MTDQENNPKLKPETKIDYNIEKPPKIVEPKDTKLKVYAIFTIVIGIIFIAVGCIIIFHYQTFFGYLLLFIGIFLIALSLDMLKYLYPDHF